MVLLYFVASFTISDILQIKEEKSAISILESASLIIFSKLSAITVSDIANHSFQEFVESTKAATIFSSQSLAIQA
jgi:hypothetical protein